MFSVTLFPDDTQFKCQPRQAVLEAALQAGIALPHSCLAGACRSCQATVKSGEVDHANTPLHSLSEKDRQENKVLLCCARPLSNLTLEVNDSRQAGYYSMRKLLCRVEHIERPTGDVAIFRLTLPRKPLFQFRAGNYIHLIHQNVKRCFSIANAPGQAGYIELHVRRVAQGVLAEYIFERMAVGDLLRIEGPIETFFFREHLQKPVILLASGTGFAPIASIIEQYQHIKKTLPECYFYWGGRRFRDLYQDSVVRQRYAASNSFHYVPVLSEPNEEDQWNGRTGFVHRAILEDFPDLSGFQVYACGSPQMVAAAHQDFIQQSGLPEENFFSDAFFPAATLEKQDV